MDDVEIQRLFELLHRIIGKLDEINTTLSQFKDDFERHDRRRDVGGSPGFPRTGSYC